MKLAQKIMLLAAAFFFSMTVFSFIFFTSLRMLGDNFNGLIDHSVASETELLKIGRDVNYFSRLTRNIMLGSNYDRDMGKMEELLTSVKNSFSVLEKALGSQEERTGFEAARQDTLEWLSKWNTAMISLRNVPAEERHSYFGQYENQISPQGAKMRESFDKMLSAANENKNKKVTSYHNCAGLAVKRAVAICLLSLLVVSGLCWWLLHTLIRPLRALSLAIKEIAEGEADLTKRLSCHSSNEIGEISSYFNIFIGRLHDIITRVTGNAVNVAGSSIRIFSAAQSMSSNMEVMTDEASMVATAGGEMSATSGDIANSCQGAAESATQANNAATEGARVVEETVTSMNQIADRVKESSRAVDNLGERSKQIGVIIGTIEDIADQTNLLALNAAIEAARAGEQGRGFAVVADEVRALAVRTTKATHEITEMITGIQEEIGNAVRFMEEGVAQAERGTEEAVESCVALIDIVDKINDVNAQVNQIAAAAQEQTATSCEISSNINRITDLSRSTMKDAQESAKESMELANLAEELQKEIRVFRTTHSDTLILDLAANDHRLFVGKVGAAVAGNQRIEPDDLANHHTCRFGIWYDDEGKKLCGSLESFRTIESPHEKIHALAKEAVRLRNGGDPKRAEAIFQEIGTLSGTIVTLLEKIKSEAMIQLRQRAA